MKDTSGPIAASPKNDPKRSDRGDDTDSSEEEVNDGIDCGYYVDSSDEEANDDIEGNAEDIFLYHYNPLYYPISIGGILAERYRIEHKLGHGGHSTVWMAYDSKKGETVAVKIPVMTGTLTDREYKMHNEVRQCAHDTSRFILSHETFPLLTPMGIRRALVFPLRGPNLSSCFADMSMTRRMSAAKQVLEALKSLHDAKIVHRDVRDENIICGVVSLGTFNLEQRYQYLGRPKKILMEPREGMPGDLVKPAVFPPSLLTNSVYLADFGIAINSGDPVNYKPQSPAIWCAPERLHDMDPSPAADIWSFMCIFAKLYLRSIPWYVDFNSLRNMVDILGPLPESWYSSFHRPGKNDASWYDQSKKSLLNLEELVKQRRPEVSSAERAHVLSFMAKGFCYDPRQRITAVQLLNDASFQAVMKIYDA